MLKKFVMLLMVFALLVSLASCSSKADTSNKGYTADVVRMLGVRDDIYIALIRHVMKDKGFFESHLPDDVAVEWPIVPGSADQRDALLNGNADIVMLNTPAFVSAVEMGMPIQIISATPYLDASMYTNRPDINGLEDLNDTDKILLIGTVGNVPHLALKTACLELFGDANKFDNQITAMQLADALATLENTNDAQAIIYAYTPGLDITSDRIKEIFSSSEYSVQYELRIFMSTSEKFAAENPVIIEAYYAAERETIEFMREHPDEAAEIIAKYWTQDSAENIAQMLRDNPPDIEVSESGYDRLASLMYDLEILENPPKKFAEFPNYDTIPKKE